MRKYLSILLLCLFTTPIFSQTFEPSVALLTNYYKKSNRPNTSSNIVTGSGFALGFRLKG